LKNDPEKGSFGTFIHDVVCFYLKVTLSEHLVANLFKYVFFIIFINAGDFYVLLIWK